MTRSNLTRHMGIGYPLFIALFATSAFANRIPVHTNQVEISLDYDPANGRLHELESIWAKACKQLGKALERNSGPWGFGLFSEHDCMPWDKRLAADANSSKPSDVWIVTLKLREDKTTISMHWPPAGTQALATVDISSKLVLNHLTNEAFAKIIAASLLDRAPVLTQIGSGATENRRRRSYENFEDKALNLPDPPSSLRMFRLEFDEESRSSSSLATAGPVIRTWVSRQRLTSLVPRIGRPETYSSPKLSPPVRASSPSTTTSLR